MAILRLHRTQSPYTSQEQNVAPISLRGKPLQPKYSQSLGQQSISSAPQKLIYALDDYSAREEQCLLWRFSNYCYPLTTATPTPRVHCYTS